MVQVKGIRGEVQRLRSERTGRVKYSTSWPWPTFSPNDARRAMPTSGGFCGFSESEKREVMRGRFFAFYSPQRIAWRRAVCQWRLGTGRKASHFHKT